MYQSSLIPRPHPLWGKGVWGLEAVCLAWLALGVLACADIAVLKFYKSRIWLVSRAMWATQIYNIIIASNGTATYLRLASHTTVLKLRSDRFTWKQDCWWCTTKNTHTSPQTPFPSERLGSGNKTSTNRDLCLVWIRNTKFTIMIDTRLIIWQWVVYVTNEWSQNNLVANQAAWLYAATGCHYTHHTCILHADAYMTLYDYIHILMSLKVLWNGSRSARLLFLNSWSGFQSTNLIGQSNVIANTWPSFYSCAIGSCSFSHK